MAALRYARGGNGDSSETGAGFGQYSVFNLGTGRGNSVLEMVEAMKRASSQPLPYEVGPRYVQEYCPVEYSDGACTCIRHSDARGTSRCATRTRPKQASRSGGTHRARSTTCAPVSLCYHCHCYCHCHCIYYCHCQWYCHSHRVLCSTLTLTVVLQTCGSGRLRIPTDMRSEE